MTFAAGGASDIVARVLSEPQAESFGQPAIVDNQPSAGGTIGGSEVARAVTSQEFTEFIARQVRDWTPAIKAADLKP